MPNIYSFKRLLKFSASGINMDVYVKLALKIFSSWLSVIKAQKVLFLPCRAVRPPFYFSPVGLSVLPPSPAPSLLACVCISASCCLLSRVSSLVSGPSFPFTKPRAQSCYLLPRLISPSEESPGRSHSQFHLPKIEFLTLILKKNSLFYIAFQPL